MILIDVERCNGCGECVAVCPSGALYLVDGKATVDATLCSDCESCIAACPTQAIACAEPALAPATELPSLPALRAKPETVQVASHTPVPWRARLLPAMGAALAWAGREIVPRLAEALLDDLDRRVFTKRRAPTSQTRPARKPSSNGRERRRRRHRGGR